MVWLATSCHSLLARLTMSGLLRAMLPNIKKVAGTSFSASISNNLGVVVGEGPSSKVRATSFFPSVTRSVAWICLDIGAIIILFTGSLVLEIVKSQRSKIANTPMTQAVMSLNHGKRMSKRRKNAHLEGFCRFGFWRWLDLELEDVLPDVFIHCYPGGDADIN